MLLNWCWRRFQRLPLDSKIKPVNPKGNEPWILIGRSNAEAPILWPPDGKSWLTGKNPDAGPDWGQGIKGDGGRDGWWRHWLDGHEDGTVGGVTDSMDTRTGRLDGVTDSMDTRVSKLEDSEGQESLERCRSWSRKESDMTEWLSNWPVNGVVTWDSLVTPELQHSTSIPVIPWQRPPVSLECQAKYCHYLPDSYPTANEETSSAAACLTSG